MLALFVLTCEILWFSVDVSIKKKKKETNTSLKKERSQKFEMMTREITRFSAE